MIDSVKLQKLVCEYKNECDKGQRYPTYCGLAKRLKISKQTISNVNKGQYNGKPYKEKEGARRCIANTDFELIRALYY